MYSVEIFYRDDFNTEHGVGKVGYIVPNILMINQFVKNDVKLEWFPNPDEVEQRRHTQPIRTWYVLPMLSLEWSKIIIRWLH